MKDLAASAPLLDLVDELRDRADNLAEENEQLREDLAAARAPTNFHGSVNSRWEQTTEIKDGSGRVIGEKTCDVVMTIRLENVIEKPYPTKV